MYKCCECGETFETPATIKEERGEFWGMTCYEEISICPYCKSSEFDDMIKCPACGEYMDSDRDYCENCIEIRDEAFASAIAVLEEYSLTYQQAFDLLGTKWEE